MSGGQAFYHFAVQFPSDAPLPELGQASLAVARDDVSGFARLITLDALVLFPLPVRYWVTSPSRLRDGCLTLFPLYFLSVVTLPDTRLAFYAYYLTMA
jgi:hypothetical protein